MMQKMIANSAVLLGFALAIPAASADEMHDKYCLKGPGQQLNCDFETMADCNDHKQGTQTCVPRSASTTGSGMSHGNTQK
jgi:hypothetical protein